MESNHSEKIKPYQIIYPKYLSFLSLKSCKYEHESEYNTIQTANP